jgi:hypothetical protein
MSLRNALAAAGLLVISTAAIAQGPRVAIMAAPGTASWNTEVQGKLVATGLFSAVDVYDLTSVTPTLAQMRQYAALLVFTDHNPVDPTTFGNNLADYVDVGGGVVASVFATASIPIEGRFNTDNYWAIQPTDQQEGTEETLGTVFVPGHPIMVGVTTFDGGTSSYRPSADSLHAQATRIANWTGGDNIALIATRVIGSARRVDLGFYPPSTDSRADFWIASTDGAKIMANSLVWVAQDVGEVIPTLGPIGLIVLIGLLALFGVLAARLR